MSPLREKVALVTGGASGIGKAAAIELASQGAKVGVLSLPGDDVDAVVREIEAGGGKAVGLFADISDEPAIQAAVAELLDTWGRLDVVFANAGINGVWAPLEEIAASEFDTTVRVNLRGTFLTLKAAAAALKRQGGSVIITSSVNGTRTFRTAGATAYSCTKAAGVAMAKMLAVEWGPFGIRVNVVCPGAISTNINQTTHPRGIEKIRLPIEFKAGADIPLTHGRAGSPQEVAQVVAFLASDRSSHISGTEIWIDGASSLV